MKSASHSVALPADVVMLHPGAVKHYLAMINDLAAH
jgi:hypothetical protein